MKSIRIFLALLTGGLLIISSTAFAVPFNNDSLKNVPINWWHMDPDQDQVPGVSTEKAYDFLKGKPSRTIVVAVIDSGIDIDHEDLKDIIWTNQREIAGNGLDDDQNGYIDDIHGWNFLGGQHGTNVKFDTYELTREYARLKKKYQVFSKSQQENDEEWEYFGRIQREYDNTVAKMAAQYQGFKEFYEHYKKAERLILAYTELDELTREDVVNWTSPDDKISLARDIILTAFDNGLDPKQMEKAHEYFTTALSYGYNLDYDPRGMIGDNINDPFERSYGNNDVKGEFYFHGTHVAGIIGASRNNNLGIDGIADNVRVMVIRAVPNGDERDKDVANAIHYAVDNGAHIINMSFGKRFSPDKEAVDKAVKHAESKGVLLIHAAGNSAHDTQVIDHYPSKTYSTDGQQASNWLEVGAVGWNHELVASFSNYGKTTVDVFAPGVDIYSTAPDQDYEKASGTSMAAPVTTGVAALLMSYFPHLSAQEVKQILIESVTDYQTRSVKIPGKSESVPFSELCHTGGVINAYRAVKLAQKSRPRGKVLQRN